MRLVIKLGGSLIQSAEVPPAWLRPIVEIAQRGHHVLLVHGGGKLVSRYLQKLGIVSQFVQGLRVTDQPALEVAIMVLAGLINKQVVMGIQRHGGRALGLCGGDAQAVIAKKMILPDGSGASADLGFVGTIAEVNPHIFNLLFNEGFIPVVASVAGTADHTYLNVNADHFASAIAGEIGADRLIYLTDVPGVLDHDGRVIRQVTSAEIDRLIADNVISGGMLPKLQACREAVAKGVSHVRIVPPDAFDINAELSRSDMTQGTWINN
ncbi:MAG: acetylglutamate kinase [Acidobacteria bacterium]|nr:acetylglutamate kinase [Acidobacteriota bacterium]MBI3655487.1 acetylglutamate kinase [Acidobacteriota bacterium]